MDYTYPSNSNKSKETQKTEEKHITPVVRGKVQVKKESIGHKMADTFLAESIQNTGKYMVNDVLIPAVVDTIVDALTSGISMLFKGSPTSRRSTYGRSGRSTDYTSFSRVKDNGRETRPTFTRDRHGLLDIVMESRGDAIEVRTSLMDIMDKYQVVSVFDYYEMCGAGNQAEYTDRKYGWYGPWNENDLQITRDRDGFRIRMPRVEVLD